MPRLRDLADQHLFKMDRQADHGCLNPVFEGTADADLIREHWHFRVRVAASLKCDDSWEAGVRKFLFLKVSQRQSFSAQQWSSGMGLYDFFRRP